MMRPLDRFVCRREGHVASVTITSANLGRGATSYISSCQRCGKVFEFPLPDSSAPSTAPRHGDVDTGAVHGDHPKEDPQSVSGSGVTRQ